MKVVPLEARRQFDAAKMMKNNLFETPRFFCDLYCLEPGQSQAPHTHEREDKVMIVLEGEGTVRSGNETRALGAGDAMLAEAGEPHGVANESSARLVVLVFMAPHPRASS